MATTLIDGGGFDWDIQDNGSISDGENDSYDGGLAHSGFGYDTSPTTEDSGREVVVDGYTSGSVSVTRKIYVPDSGTGFARFLEIVTNNGTSATTYNLGISTNLGSDGYETYINTSSGDSTFTTADQWIVTDDGDGTGDTTVGHVFAGTGGIAPSSVTKTSGYLTYNFSLSLSPGETQVIMHFGVQAANQADAATAVAYIQGQPTAIFSGMSSDEISQIVNYSTGPVTNATYAIATTANSDKAEGNSGDTNLTFTVTRSGDVSGTGSVGYVVAGSGTDAASADDFSGGALPSGTVNFTANQTSKTITVTVSGDSAFESDETFTVTLQNATSGSVSSTDDAATGTILNDDMNSLTTADDEYSGTTGNDFVAGLGGDDQMLGLDGNDGLSGGSGDDQLRGGSGDDTLAGGNGDDFLFGGSGNDVLYSGSAPDWASDDDTQTSSASGTIPATGQTLAISLTAPETTSDGTVSATGLVSRSTASSSQFNIVYIIDRSGSMSSTFSGTETVPDMNGNSYANELMDAAISSFESLNASLAGSGFGSSLLGIVEFGSTASAIYNGQLNVDANSNGRSDAADAMRLLTASGSTNFTASLDQAITFFQAAPQGNNYIFFISDGYPDSTSFSTQVQTLISPSGINATIRAIGLGSGASLTALDLVDDGLSNSSATRVDTPSNLTSGLIAPPVDSADIDRVEILRNGVLVDTIQSSALVSTPLGLQFTTNVSGLNLDDNTLVARVIATDASSTTVSTSLTIGTGIDNNHLFGGSGNDTLFGGNGMDAFDGGSGSDTVSFAAVGSEIKVNLAQTGYQDTLGAGQDAFISIENIIGSAMADNLTGSAAANTLTGGGGNDTLNGGAGNDSLNGGAGNDTLNGAAGNDTLSGGIGNDTLDGGLGADDLTGGAGTDIFQLASSAAADTITDFTSGTDKVRVKMSAIRIGDGDAVVESSASVAGPGSFTTAAELVIVTGNISGAITTTSAAAKIGSATSAYTAGAKRLFVVDDGSSSALFLFTSSGADAAVSATELTQLASFDGTASTALADYIFVA